ncbi:MAG: hypothetical protein KDB27_05240 [Planctomycetales bacterium]|nr:hypothetical protein [Planctomycetales bacterium]
MARGSRPAKVQEWTQRMQRFDASSLTVAEFCEAEGVSAQSYYHWKRKLGEASRPRSRFQSVRVSPAAGRSPSERTTIRLGKGIHIELGDDLSMAKQVVHQVLAVVIGTDHNTAANRTKAK